MNVPTSESIKLMDDLRLLIAQSRQRVAVVINAEITRMYWAIGKRINEDVLPRVELSMESKRSGTSVNG